MAAINFPSNPVEEQIFVTGGKSYQWDSERWALLSSTPSRWVRPPDWLSLPAVTAAESKFVGLHAVFQNANFCALTASGNFTVDWGDGTIENFTSGATAQHEYSYANSLLDGTLTSQGYKQVIITVTPQAGQTFTSINLQKAHSAITGSYLSGFLDITLAGPSLTTGGVSEWNATLLKAELKYLEQATILAEGLTTFTGMFSGCISLQSVPLFNTSAGTAFYFMFQDCISLKTVPLFDTSFGTDFEGMFKGCKNLRSAPLFDTGSGTLFISMFQDCISLQAIPLLSTSSGEDFISMFAGCSSLRSVPLLNTAGGSLFSTMFFGCASLSYAPLLNTALGSYLDGMFSGCSSLQSVPLLDTGSSLTFNSMFSDCSALQSVPLLNTALGSNFGSMFLNCTSLQAIPLLNTALGTTLTSMFTNCPSLARIEVTGFKVSFSVASCKLSAAMLDLLFTNLPTVTAKTITITGNYGAATCTRSIATAKGWTVTG